jgi:hypothetical protein
MPLREVSHDLSVLVHEAQQLLHACGRLAHAVAHAAQDLVLLTRIAG